MLVFDSRIQTEKPPCMSGQNFMICCSAMGDEISKRIVTISQA
jgi:hypothetical protein